MEGALLMGYVADEELGCGCKESVTADGASWEAIMDEASAAALRSEATVRAKNTSEVAVCGTSVYECIISSKILIILFN